MENTDTPDASGIEAEFRISSSLDDLPLSECPAYLNESIQGVCRSGTATIVVFTTKFRVAVGTGFVLIPWQLVSLKEVSDDFAVDFFRVSAEMFTDCLSTLWRLTPDFFFYMCKHVASQPDAEHIRRFGNYCQMLSFWEKNSPPACRRETVMQLLRFSYWTVYTLYIADPNANKGKYSRKEELAFRFMRLIVEEHAPSLDVAHYAAKLGVTSKYLTNQMKSISGRSARDWIVYFQILEIKSLLREASIDLKSVASRANFPDQSTLSRFFRHYTGMTPSQYRERIHL